MTVEELQQQLARSQAAVCELQAELAQTNRGVAAMVLELEQRLEERLSKLKDTETTIQALQEELHETSRGLVALNLELEQRVDTRTAELRQLTQELEARVQERTAQLQQANENLQNFAHSAAHDLRSPLRTIASFTTMALEDHGTQLGPEGQFLLQRVVQASGQMSQLLNDLLEYSKISQAELKLERVSLQEAVRTTLGMLDADIRTRNASITVADGLPEVVGHPATVVLLINNYVSNALKFIAPGVQPHIRIWSEVVPAPKAVTPGHTAPPAAPATSASTHMVRLWVEDNGIGIPPEALSKVFGVFQRLHGKSAFPGTGLGLAIVRKGTERMGGAVGLESTAGKGSRFWFQLPQAPSGAAAKS
jgi:signal transduction histidine kinase